MDATTAAILAAVAGLIVGIAITSLRARARSRTTDEPTDRLPSLPDGVSAVLAVLPSIPIVLDAHERVVSDRGPGTTHGLVNGGRIVSPVLLDLLRRVRHDGVVREVELDVAETPPHPSAFLHVRVSRLLDHHLLVLVEDRTQSRRVEEVRRDFVVNVSHELKTPVGGMSLLAEAMADAKDDPAAVERFAQRMQLESARLTALIKEIVDLSRLQGAEGVTDPRRILLRDVIEEAVELSLVEAQAKDIRIVEKVQPDVAVIGDMGLLVTAVRNLVSNAVAYSPPGTLVGVGGRATQGAARITVTDRGHGIPQGERERIFERFYRVDTARSRSTGGTGLGLAIVKHICANHGGTVSVWSQEGLGSTFTMRLPLAPETAPARPPDTSPRAAEPVAAGADPQGSRT